MSRTVQLVLVCEDRQHETFVRRFLKKAGWSARCLRVEIAPRGRGAADQFVRERFPKELRAYRTHRHRVARGLVVMVDGDQQGVAGRHNELARACEGEGVQPRKPDEQVAIIVPTWNIETWFAYLEGEGVDEGRKDYPRLNRPRDCQRHVEQLYEMCQQGELREPAPHSLKAACDEYRTRMPS